MDWVTVDALTEGAGTNTGLTEEQIRCVAIFVLNNRQKRNSIPTLQRRVNDLIALYKTMQSYEDAPAPLDLFETLTYYQEAE